MSLSPHVAERLERARLSEAEYWPDESVCRQLGEKTLVMVVGPAAVGKSTVMERAAELDHDFRLVPVFTSRDPRPDDAPGLFRTYPHTDNGISELLDKIETHRVVNYAIHPTQQRIYGTEVTDYPGRYNLLATLSNAVAQLRPLPFKETHVIGLAVDPDTYASWFNERYPEKNEARAKRLGEALVSLDWLLDEQNQAFVTWIENIKEHPDHAARQIIEAIRHGADPSSRGAETAKAMRAWAEEAATKDAAHHDIKVVEDFLNK